MALFLFAISERGEALTWLVSEPIASVGVGLLSILSSSMSRSGSQLFCGLLSSLEEGFLLDMLVQCAQPSLQILDESTMLCSCLLS